MELDFGYYNGGLYNILMKFSRTKNKWKPVNPDDFIEGAKAKCKY